MKKIAILFLFLFTLIFAENGSKVGKNIYNQIWDEIYNSEFESARTMVLAELKKDKDNIKLLSLYEIIYNALDKPDKANKARDKILKLWNQNHKESYLKENYPVNLSNYTRVVKFYSNHILIGAEYFIPYPVNQKMDGYYYYKFTAFNKNSKSVDHLYKLEKSKLTNEDYVLFEVFINGKSERLKSYNKEIPDISQCINDISSRLKK